MTEKEIVRGCRRGKRIYQKALYDRYAPKLLGICFRYFPDEVRANDLLQEVFIRIFEKIASFREEGSLEGWVKRITVNLAINEIRKQKRRFDEVSLDESIDVAGVLQDDAADLLRIISELPDGYREIFNLHAIEGYKFKEIGKILSMSEVNVRVRYHRARKKLHRQLQQHFLN